MTAVEYLRSIGYPTAHSKVIDFWRDCERGDWLLQFASLVGVDQRVLALAKADCAEMAIPCCRNEWVASVCEAVLEVVRRWAVGAATDEELREARNAARAAADAAAAAAAADADAYADAYAYAASSSSSAYAAAAAVRAARLAMRRRTADAVRAAIPWRVVAAAIGRSNK